MTDYWPELERQLIAIKCQRVAQVSPGSNIWRWYSPRTNSHFTVHLPVNSRVQANEIAREAGIAATF